MANQRKAGKRLVGFFATEEEQALLKQGAKLAGFETMADYLRWVAQNQPKPPVSRPPRSAKTAAGKKK